MRRLHLIKDVEHAHSSGVDVAVFGYRDLSGCGLCLDVLGNRAEDVQAASQERSYQIGNSGSIARHHELRAMRRVCVIDHHSQFSEKLFLFFEAFLDGCMVVR
jgi:hypothetical protein